MAKVSYDPKVLGQALAEARRRGATPREMKALVEAGLVESGLRNLSGGDRDSVGFLQQRASQGWTGLTNVPKATDEFLAHAHALTAQGFHGSAGQLAQAVQRSAFPGRYNDRAGDAATLLSGTGGGGTSQGTSQGTESGSQSPDASQSAGIDPAALVSLLTQQQRAPQIQSAGIQAPAFAAHAVTPAGSAVPQGGGGPAPAPDVSPLLAAIAGSVSQASPDLSSVAGAPAQASGGGGGGVQGSGTVKIAPGANRPGVSLTPGVLKVVRAVAAQAGEPLTVGTGTNHNRLTVDGNVSDHWSGNATDIPSSGSKLTTLGQQALISAGMDPAQARKEKGGLFNLPYGKHRRIQIIFNTNEGGNHFNHLHVGVTAK